MEVYRITLKKWANDLVASGHSGRWNSKGKYVEYTSSSRALVSLENIVHRSREGLNNTFKSIVKSIPNNIKIKELHFKKLSKFWFKYENYRLCQAIGDSWLKESKTAVSAISNSKNGV